MKKLYAEFLVAAQGAGISDFYSSDDDHVQRNQYQQAQQMQQTSHLQQTQHQIQQHQQQQQQQQVVTHQQMNNPYGNVEDFQVIVLSLTKLCSKYFTHIFFLIDW